MKGYKMPLGVQDYIGVEAARKSAIEDMLTNFYEQNGHFRIETPTIEFLDLFSSDHGIIDNNKLFKFTDKDGSLLTLRPDITTGISRVISTKLNNVDKLYRLCYKGNSFNFECSNNSLREFTQVGVEAFGKSSEYIDADIISLAIKSMQLLEIEDFKIEIGDVGFFNSFLDTLSLSIDKREELSSYVEKKDTYSINNFCLENNISKKDQEFLSSLIYLFGNEEVFDKAIKISSKKETKQRVEYIKRVYQLLCDSGYRDYIAIDFSIVNSFNYYTGIVFKGITKYLGVAILSGGRYDTLCSSVFSKNIEAIGFSLGVNNAMRALKNISNQTKYKNIDYLVGYSKDSIKEVNEFINSKINDGYCVFNTHILNYDEFKIECEKFKDDANNYVFITNKGEMYINGSKRCK